jgi:energy-coupling factor transporter ATP-binding protein EcfA2
MSLHVLTCIISATYHLSGGQMAKSLGIDPEKGILLVGNTGVGKTMLFRVFQRFYKDTHAKFRWVSAADLKHLADEVGLACIAREYGTGLKCDLYIDHMDLINEPHSKRHQIISDLISIRNDMYVRQGFKTHISSYLPKFHTHNHTHDSLINMYELDYIDRLRQMTNLIVWEGKSLRRRENGWEIYK